MNSSPNVSTSRRGWSEDRRLFNQRAEAQLQEQQQQHSEQMDRVQGLLERAETALADAATASENARSIAEAKREEIDALIEYGREELNVIKDQVIAGQQIERADDEHEAYSNAVKEARWWLIGALAGVAVGILLVWLKPPDSTFAAWLSRGGVFAASLIAFRGSQMASRRAEDHRVSAEVLKHQGLGHATINAYIAQGDERAHFDDARRRVVNTMITGHLNALSSRMLGTQRGRRRRDSATPSESS